MEQETLIESFEKEYFAEAVETKVTVDDLKKFGVSNKTLSGEIYLINMFGNEIVKHNFIDDVDENAEGVVTGLDESDILFSKQFSEILNEIETSKFDDNLDTAIGGIEL